MKPAFTGKDKIVLHFNRVLPRELEEKTNEILARKYVDHISTHKFGSIYAAKCFVQTVQELSEEVVPHPSQTWVRKNWLYLNNWIMVSSDRDSEEQLCDIMAHEYTSEEKKWKLPHPYDEYARQIAYHSQGTHPQINSHTRAAQGKPPLTEEERKRFKLTPREKPRETAKEQKPAQDRKTAKPKRVKSAMEGIVTLGAICVQLKFDPKEARQALRKAKVEKPANGWQWPEEDKDKVTKIVKNAVEKLRSKK